MQYEFSKTTKFVPEWNKNSELEEAERVSMTLSVLSMGDVLRVMDILEGSSAPGGNVDSNQLDMATTGKLVEYATGVLPTYVSEFANLEGPEGPVGVSDICQYPQFIGLIIEILFQLVSISTPSEEDTKN